MSGGSGIRLLVLSVLLIGLCATPRASGTPQDPACTYPDFSSLAGLSLIGVAAQNGTALELTPAVNSQVGCAWCTAKPDVAAGFETRFEFRIALGTGSEVGADGFAFVVQGQGPQAQGEDGVNIGYGTIPNSLAVEFDTYFNREVVDPVDNHVAVMCHGTEPNTPDHISSLGTQTFSTPINDGAVHWVKIEYVPGTMKVYVDDASAPMLAVQVDLAQSLQLEDGRAWVGFTSATGGESESHEILSWAFGPAGGPCTIACAATGPPSVEAGVYATFTASSAVVGCPGSVAYDWDFGDGSAHSAERDPHHAYQDAGTYAWTMTARAGDQACTKTASITVRPQVVPPAVSVVSQASDPFRLLMHGSAFQPGIQAYVGGGETPWAKTVFKGSTLVVLKGGASLKALFPKGRAVQILLANPDGGQALTSFTRR